ncbi:putative ankyrin repeat protein [Chloropicon roscoffensis]|uniref:Ankyrin repeat protein n=1 Tax=Chloropicon roscoffensis TaxID=1461544 RepID=A0AAX4PAN7_9CHLO
MVEQKKRRREGTDTDQGEVKALRQEVERLRQENEELREERVKPREENEGLKLRNPKVEAESQTPQEEDKEVKLPTELWAIIAGKLDENDVCSFALVSKQLREAQVLAGRKLVTRPVWKVESVGSIVDFFTEDWCAYWSSKFIEEHTDPELIKRVLYVAACEGYLQVFEKYWSQGPQEKHRKLWDEETCGWAAHGGHLEVLKWLRAKGCPWGKGTSNCAAEGGQLEVLQWMRGQDPPCPWDSRVCSDAASEGHLEVLRWARSQGCPWNEFVPIAAAENGHLEVLQWMRDQDPPCPWDSHVCYFAAGYGHLEVLRWARSQGCPWDERVPCAAAEGGQLKVLVWLINEGCPHHKSACREAAAEGGERARKVLEWLDDETSDETR